MRDHRWVWALVAVLWAGACKKEAPKEEAAPKEEPAAEAPGTGTPDVELPSPPDAPAQAATEPPKVTLLEPGAEPRRELRFAPREGARRTVVFRMDTDMQVKVNGQSPPAASMPPATMTMTIETVEVGEDASKYRITITQVKLDKPKDMPPELFKEMRSAFDQMKGITGVATIDARGIAHGVEMDIPPGARPDLRQVMASIQQSFDQVAAPFPEEPVGKGARWTVETTLVQNDVRLQQTATYSLVELGRNHIAVDLALEQTAPEQTLRPQGPGGPTMTLMSLESKGGGKARFGFDVPVPTRADLKVHSESKMALDLGGQKQNVEMVMDMSMEMRQR